MGTTVIPGWLVPAYSRAAVGAGATADPRDVQAAGDRLVYRWSEPTRRFHGIGHLVDLLQYVDELQQETQHPHIVRLAAWYHGAIFDAAERAAYAKRGGEDEVASAQYARDELSQAGLEAAAVDKVANLVAGLARHATGLGDAAVLSDADLAVLASDPQRYKHYVKSVREEYAHIPTERFLAARRAIVTKILSRERIYTTPLGQGWEAQARQNLQAELAWLSREDQVLLDTAALVTLTEDRALHASSAS
ncbi:HD domain-containing protein [Demequina litorisediminis]|uniref:Metal-dependent HD superfamily phosphohydrolase n=1 Tax=Demequina litorisediminis TaxID=1849022 RepID=A0ABQ6ICE3_9MICO|nr:hypothetical protein [Demequina litorisediminis]GMA35106.1 hypothetical protein GCM10025876_13100 [Demequina litorisediminis]